VFVRQPINFDNVGSFADCYDPGSWSFRKNLGTNWHRSGGQFKRNNDTIRICALYGGDDGVFVAYIANNFDIRLLVDGVVEHIPPDSGGVRNQHANLFLLQGASLSSRMLAKSGCATQGPEGSNFGAGTFLPVWRSRGLARTSTARVQVLNLTRWFASVR
jgi:hypothetical protein